MSDLEKLKTEIALLKKDAKTGELIHQRLEVAVDKLTEITISLKGMIAQQQTKLERAEQTDDDIFVTLEARRKEIANTLFQSKIEAEPISDPKPEVADPSPRTEPTAPEVKAEPEVEATPEVEVKADEPESK